MHIKTKFFIIILFSLLLLDIAPINVYSMLDQKDSPSIVVSPFTQNTKLNSIFVIWETDIPTLNNEVHWGLTKDLGNISWEKFDFFNEQRNLHSVKLVGLIPSTKYYYKVVSDSIESKIYSFHTAFERNKTVRFIAYGDSRGVWDNWTNAKIVADAIEKERPYFILHTGDIVNNGTIKDQWIDFFAISNFIHNSTLFPTLGNHEKYGDDYFKYFSLPNNELWYSFDSGSVHFIGLDSNNRNSLRLSQLFWLIKDLRLNSKTFTIVFFHYPPYSSGNHGSTYFLRFLWGFIFEYFNVDIVFNGHDHCYERGNVKSVNYVVTGGGGAPLYDVGNSWWTIYSEKTYHYCLVTANNEELVFEAKKPDGIVIDSFIITK